MSDGKNFDSGYILKEKLSKLVIKCTIPLRQPSVLAPFLSLFSFFLFFLVFFFPLRFLVFLLIFHTTCTTYSTSIFFFSGPSSYCCTFFTISRVLQYHHHLLPLQSSVRQNLWTSGLSVMVFEVGFHGNIGERADLAVREVDLRE